MIIRLPGFYGNGNMQRVLPFFNQTTYMYLNAMNSSCCLMLALFITCAFQLSAQEEQKIMAVPVKNHQWGARLDFSGNESYPNIIPIIGATYSFKKHQVFAGIMLNPFEERKVKSPLLGSYISYQYYPFRQRRHFNAFAYYANDLGKYTYDAAVSYFSFEDSTVHPAHGHYEIFVMTNTIGIGFESRFGRHVYANLSAGPGLRFTKRHNRVTYDDPQNTPVPTGSPKDRFGFSFEIKAGIGYRF
jgi:hypothetical protein